MTVVSARAAERERGEGPKLTLKLSSGKTVGLSGVYPSASRTRNGCKQEPDVNADRSKDSRNG